MASLNPSEYYSNQDNHGSYSYETLENLVNNYQDAFTGDDSLIGNVPRRKILFWMKKGIQKFTQEALREVKIIELELTDNLDIILPPDYVEYVRISYLDTETGDLRPLMENKRMSLAVSYLQDHQANVLFDNNGYILQGTSATELINNEKTASNSKCYSVCGEPQWGIDTGKNYNGMFNVDKRAGRIHFSSEVKNEIIVLEYISDGLEYEDESEIKVSKMAEQALYSWCTYNLVINRVGMPLYEKTRVRNEWDKEYRNAKVKLMNIKIAEFTQRLKGQNRWFK